MSLKVFRSAATLSFSVALAGVVLAQGSSQPQTPTTSGQGAGRGGMQSGGWSKSMDGQTVTLVGCLMEDKNAGGQQSAARTGGDQDFVLMNVQMSQTSTTAGNRPGTTSGAGTGTSATGTTGTGTTGTAGTTGSTGTAGATGTGATGTTAGGRTGATGDTASAMGTLAAGMSVRLRGMQNDQLKQNLNKQVEVTGRLEIDDDAASGAANRGSGASGGTTASGSGTGATGTTGSATGTSGSGTSGTTGATTGAAGGTGSGGRQTASGGAGNQQVPELHATNIRVVAQTCTAPRQ